MVAEVTSHSDKYYPLIIARAAAVLLLFITVLAQAAVELVVDRQRIDPAAFTPPAGYRRQQMFPGTSSSQSTATGGQFRQPRR